MFGSLKKRLKDAVEKVSKGISKEEPGGEKKEEKSLDELIQDVPSQPTPGSKPSQPSPPAKEGFEEGEELLFGPADALEEEVDRKIEELEEIKEKISEEKLPQEVAESKAEAEEAAKEEKKRQGFFFFKKITEKKLGDSEIEGVLKELHMALLENDVAVEVADRISDDVKIRLLNAVVKRGKVEDTIKGALRNAMLNVMKQEKIDLEKRIEEKDGPFTIMLVGFNGTGKTSTAAKLAYRFKNYKPVLAAADTFRAASIEQLEEHGRRLDVRVVKHTYGADAAAVIFDAKKHAAASGSKLVLGDTAGRSHSNVNLMDELKKVVRVNQPDMKILVLDSVTGNDIYDQCRLFNDAVGVDAIILTKADVYERGGAALSAAYTLKKPILYLGVGQDYSDLKEFEPEEIVENLLG